MVDVVEEGVDKVGRVAICGKLGAREVADGLADCAGDDDASDENARVGPRCEEKREHAVPVENVGDDNVESCDAGLGMMVSNSGSKRQNRSCVRREQTLTTTRVPIKAEGAA